MLDALSNGDMRPFSRQDFLADDWEVQDIAVSITRKQFWDAYSMAVNETGPNFTLVEGIVGVMAHKLGLQ